MSSRGSRAYLTQNLQDGEILCGDFIDERASGGDSGTQIDGSSPTATATACIDPQSANTAHPTRAPEALPLLLEEATGGQPLARLEEQQKLQGDGLQEKKASQKGVQFAFSFIENTFG